MNHRRGQRWRIELAIRIGVGETLTPHNAWLLDLSYHGARVRLHCNGVKAGEPIAVWLPKRAQPIRALVVHCHDDTLGLLWMEHSSRVEHLLTRIMPQPEAGEAQPGTRDTPAYGPKRTVGFGLPQTLPNLVVPNR